MPKKKEDRMLYNGVIVEFTEKIHSTKGYCEKLNKAGVKVTEQWLGKLHNKFIKGEVVGSKGKFFVDNRENFMIATQALKLGQYDNWNGDKDKASPRKNNKKRNTQVVR